jgi:hypothetical protein
MGMIEDLYKYKELSLAQAFVKGLYNIGHLTFSSSNSVTNSECPNTGYLKRKLCFKNGVAHAMVESRLNFPSGFMYRLSETSIQLCACLQEQTGLSAVSESVPLGL